jgi:DNA invertase Pin-like site-specific DNA recombinase
LSGRELDRLSRPGVADALRLVHQIAKAGGSIAALDLGLDPT